MKKIIISLIGALLIIILQQAVFSGLAVFNTCFDSVYVFVICYSLQNEQFDGVTVALFSGIVRDAFFPSVFGVNTILFLTSAYIASLVSRRIYKDVIVIPAIMTFILTVYKSIIYYSYFYIAGIQFEFGQKLITGMLIEAVMNTVIGIFMFRIIHRINTLKVMQREWRF